MIDDYRALAIFATVAETDGFTAAGRKLKLSTSVVSHHVSRLEERLGTSLFFRSTRSISLTPEGARLLPAAKRMVAAGTEAFDALAETVNQPVGNLRVAMPAFGSDEPVTKRVWQFAGENPRVSLSLDMSDVQADLIKDGYDVAIRLGTLDDSALRTRKIGTFHRVLVAAPQYLEAAGRIENPQDLKGCAFIGLGKVPSKFSLLRGKEKVEVTPKNLRIEVNTVTGAKEAILAGIGMQRLPLSEVRTELEAGTLVHILPDWSLPVSNIYAVWPANAQLKHLTRHFIDFIAQRDDR
jgi:DNA-binding transcriptional LysR family regulator